MQVERLWRALLYKLRGEQEEGGGTGVSEPYSRKRAAGDQDALCGGSMAHLRRVVVLQLVRELRLEHRLQARWAARSSKAPLSSDGPQSQHVACP